MPTTSLPENEERDLIEAEKNLQDKNLYDKIPGGSKSESSSNLYKKESDSGNGGNFQYTGGSKGAHKASSTSSNAPDNVIFAGKLNAANAYRFFLGSKKKKGGVAGAIIITTVLFFISLGSGPAQFIQLAQLMQQFHFDTSEDQGDLRAYKLYRYIKSGGNASETRVGAIGSRLGNKIEARFKAAGFEYRSTGPAGFFDGFKVDTGHPRYKNMSNSEIVTELNRKGITATINGSEVEIPANENFGTNRALMENMMKEVGYHKATAAIQARTVAGRWFGFARWHPMRLADARVNEAVGVYWDKIRKKFNDDVEKGSYQITSTLSKKTYPDPPCTPYPECATQAQIEEYNRQKTEIDAYNQRIDEINNEVKAIDDEVKSTAGEKTKRGKYTRILADNLSKKLLGGAVLSAVSPTVVVCLLYQMNQTYENVKQSSIILPLIRESLHVIALGNQVMNGRDFTPEELGAYNQLMSDGATGSWMNAQSIQAQLGTERTKPLTDDEKDQQNNLKSIGKSSPFSGVIGAMNDFMKDFGLSVGGLCSTAGQIIIGVVTVVISIFSGGSFSVVSMLGNAVVGGAIQAAIQAGAMKLFAALLAGTAVDTYGQVGAMFGTNVDYGAVLANSGNNIAKGGTKLSTQQASRLQQIAAQDAQQKFASRSLAYRLLNPNDPRSTLAKMIVHQPSSISQTFAKMSASFFNIGNMFANIPNYFGATAHAQSYGVYDYGFPQYGFSVGDMDNPAVQNPFENAKAAAAILKNNPTLKVKASKCFGVNFVESPITNPATGVTVNALGIEHVEGVENAPNPYNKDASNTDRYENLGCDDTSSDWLKIRFFIFDTTTMDAISCFEEDDVESCTRAGFPPATPATAGGGGGPVDCSSTAGDPSPGTPPAQFRALIEGAAQNLTCPDYPKPAGAFPSTPGKQYMALDGCSDGCRDQGENGEAACAGPKLCIKVQYRNPPLSGNTLFLCYANCGSGASPTSSPPANTGGGTNTGVCTEFPNGRRWVGGPNAGQPC